MQRPSDRLSQQIAEHYALPKSSYATRLSHTCHSKQHPNDILGRMEHALQLQTQAEPIARKLKQTGSISADEEKILSEFEQARIVAIKAVDEF